MENFQHRFALAFLGYAVQRNISAQRLCKQSGILYEKLGADAKYSLTAEQINTLWKNVCHVSNDNLFGLHFGTAMQLPALSVVGQVIQTSSTIGEALTHAGAMIPLLTEMFQMQIQPGKTSFVLRFLADKTKAETFKYTYRQMADYLMAFVVHELDGFLDEKIQPVITRFPYPIAETTEYERIFRGSVLANSSELEIELDNKYWDKPILTADYDLQDYFLQKMNGWLQNTGAENTLPVRIYNYLLSNAYLFNMSLESVAANFNISPRSLQRKLREEGIGFSEIVESVKQKVAISYLDSGNYQIKDISYILGYNEQSAFLRAFKKWTGKTPTEYKNQQ